MRFGNGMKFISMLDTENLFHHLPMCSINITQSPYNFNTHTLFFYQKSLYKYTLYNKASAAFKLQIKSQKFIPNKAISYG